MTPFSTKLKALRESRGLLQKELAFDTGVSATYFSALEHGRKPPPQNREFFSRLRSSLQLSDEEIKELQLFAAATETLGPLASGASPLQLEIATDFAAKLTSLQPKHIRAIRAILDLSEPSLETTASVSEK